MSDRPKRWGAARRRAAYVELEHPSDMLLEIRGRELPELLENALLAFYDQVAEPQGFAAERRMTLDVSAVELAEALRSLMSEALYRFDTEGFVAVAGDVTVEARAGAEAPLEGGGPRSTPLSGDPRSESPPGGRNAEEDSPVVRTPKPSTAVWRLHARLWGQNANRERHSLLHEIKAVTYHRLSVTETDRGWVATVLLDT